MKNAGAAPSASVSLSAWTRRLNMSNGIAGIVRGSAGGNHEWAHARQALRRRLCELLRRDRRR